MVDIGYIQFNTLALARAKRVLSENVSHKRTFFNQETGRFEKEDVSGNYFGAPVAHESNNTYVIFFKRNRTPAALLVGETLLTTEEAKAAGYQIDVRNTP